MKETIKHSIRFSLALLLILSITFAIHQLGNRWNEIEFTSHLIIEAYWVNYLMVVLTYFFLLLMKRKNNQAVGFIFLGGFFFKLLIFMLIFNPVYKADDEILTAEFFAFFMPYSICLTLETISLVRILNRS